LFALYSHMNVAENIGFPLKCKARLPARAQVSLGDTVGLAFRSENLVVFDATSGRATRSALYEGDGHG
ncbi:MAG TPA: hypothetical protein VEH77_06545, partial [Roseiarcus sp.]|nr:hypothetical protein [Roseiarcus sp.]